MQTPLYAEWKLSLMRIWTILEPSEEGGYTVAVPALPGCISEGDDIDEALATIREAIDLYFESVEDDWLPDENRLVQEIVV